MQNPEKVLEELFHRTAQGIKFGLKRIAAAAEAIGNPQNTFHAIHVAGTNGKGSVCAFLESMLRQEGYITGLYTSPHIVRFEERFIVNGRCVPAEEWLEVYQDIEDIVNRYTLTFFEIATLIAFELFKRKKVAWAVIETGLGGRLDATNILHPDACVVTAVGIEHTDYLGTSITAIAQEKLGIVKDRVPLIIAGQQTPDIITLARKICAQKDSPCITADVHDAKSLKEEDGCATFRYQNRKVKVPLCGRYQVANAVCALKTIEILHCTDIKTAIEGIAETVLPARFQRTVVRGREVIFDVAHNPMAVDELCRLLSQRYHGISVCIIAGILADKDKKFLMRRYASCATSLVITRPDTPRAARPSDLIRSVPENFKGNVTIKESVKDAIAYAFGECGGVLCITGSFYTVGEAMRELCIEPYGTER